MNNILSLAFCLSLLCFFSCKKELIKTSPLHTKAILKYTGSQENDQGCGFILNFDATNYKFSHNLDSSFQQGGVVDIEYEHTKNTTICSRGQINQIKIINLYSIKKVNW